MNVFTDLFPELSTLGPLNFIDLEGYTPYRKSKEVCTDGTPFRLQWILCHAQQVIVDVLVHGAVDRHLTCYLAQALCMPPERRLAVLA